MHKKYVIIYTLIFLYLSLVGGVFMHMDGVGILAIVAAIIFFGYIYCTSLNPESGGGGGDVFKTAAENITGYVFNSMLVVFFLSNLTSLSKYIQNNIDKLTESQITNIQEFCESMKLIIPTKGPDNPDTSHSTNKTSGFSGKPDKLSR